MLCPAHVLFTSNGTRFQVPAFVILLLLLPLMDNALDAHLFQEEKGLMVQMLANVSQIKNGIQLKKHANAPVQNANVISTPLILIRYAQVAKLLQDH